MKKSPGKVPSLSVLIAGVIHLRTDRAALVREATADRHAGLMILMLSTQAVRDIGPVIVAFDVGELEVQPFHFEKVFRGAGILIHVDDVFGILGRDVQAFDMLDDATIAILLGHITPALCQALSDQRCPTALK